MRNLIPKAGLTGAAAALGLTVCCVLPVALVVLGAGGSSLALFAPLAAASGYVLAASAAIIALGWTLAIRRGATRQSYWMLASGTAISAVALLIFLGEGRINALLTGGV